MAKRLLSLPELHRWHAHLNTIVFDDCLPTCPITIGTSRYTKEPICGEYYPNGYGLGLILIDSESSGALCVDTLAHEMIHQWQDITGNRLDHRGLFNAWKARINELTGLVA